ncbi:hypothetical protein D1AOALGA4SA_8629 [Olavius algarvensis Delta 1 endosymbiont]|nr:hypothetical protein D1AOALGA4SA_8629 [Olavius algarvensis Delta 1 endosymbiont]
MWLLYEFPFWIYCVVSGFCIPFVIESRRIYYWTCVLGGIFVLNSILFTSVHYAEEPTLFDNSTRFLNIIFPLVLCPAGAFLRDRWSNRKPEQPRGADGV